METPSLLSSGKGNWAVYPRPALLWPYYLLLSPFPPSSYPPLTPLTLLLQQVPVKRGLGAGHSCFPFLLNDTAAIWTRRLCSSGPCESLQTGLALRASASGSCSTDSPSAPRPELISSEARQDGPCLQVGWTRNSNPKRIKAGLSQN